MIPFPDDPLLALFESLSGTHVDFYPNCGNAGDGFIAHATFTLLKHFEIEYTARRQEDVVAGTTVLIGGGGNLIDGQYGDVAGLISRLVPDNRVILLPHTIVGHSSELAHTSGSLSVYCREPVSYQLALANGANPDQLHLSHDMTFFLEDDHFSEFWSGGEGTLEALRTDAEATGHFVRPSSSVDPSLSWNGDIWQSPLFAANSTRCLAAYIQPYRRVLTDRLHVSILGAFLRKDVALLPNSYFKNRAVFEHSIRPRFDDVHFVNTSPEAEGVVRVSTIDHPTEDLLDAHTIALRIGKLQDQLAAHEAANQQLLRQIVELNESNATQAELSVEARRTHELLAQSWHDRIARSESERQSVMAQLAEVAGRAMQLEKKARAGAEAAALVARLEAAPGGIAAMEQLARQSLEAQRQLHKAEADRRSLEAKMNAMASSRSWRITGPARALSERRRSHRDEAEGRDVASGGKG